MVSWKDDFELIGNEKEHLFSPRYYSTWIRLDLLVMKLRLITDAFEEIIILLPGYQSVVISFVDHDSAGR